MEPLIELCDLISQNPTQFIDKLNWLCSRCPPIDSIRVSKSHLNAILAVARFLSQSPSSETAVPNTTVIDFIRCVPASFHDSFWPRLDHDAIARFYGDFLAYVSKATEISPEFGEEVAGLMGEVVMCGIRGNADGLLIARSFLIAVSRHFLPILNADAENLVDILLKEYVQMTMSNQSEASTSSVQSSPIHGNRYYSREIDSSPGYEGSQVSSSGSISRITDDVIMRNGGSVEALVASFERESAESLERQEIAFNLIGHVLDKVQLNAELSEKVRETAKKQLSSMPAFLRLHKRDWSEQGPLLKARINTTLSVYQAAVKLQMKSLASNYPDGKISKRLLETTYALLTNAAQACVNSMWRKLRSCEELFASLLAGITQVAVTPGRQLLHGLLTPFKHLVLNVCAKADTWGSSQGAMFESVMKSTCEIIEFGWTKERAAVDSFIMALASNIRELNNYEEQNETEKQAVPIQQLNIIRFLADLNVSINKSEVVDMILPLFIESLEEGDASFPGLLRLRLIDAVSRMASLGFEKSYRETIVLMTRSYMGKLSSIGSAESKTLAPEVTTERVETLPAGFLLVASGLSSTKLRTDYRHRLLSLCSDVGLAAEAKPGRNGADFLGPLLPAVAEICADFDPTVRVEPSLLKLFRNFWFYVALFGLAPPIQKNQLPTRLVSSTLNSVGSMSAAALQAVGGPYMWTNQWSSAVQRIAQGTPALVVSSVKWLEDELELNALHNSGSRRGSSNEKAALTQRTALSAALGGGVEVSAMSTISGVKATYLLAVAFLEIIRFSSNGGILNGGTSITASRSAFSCVFEYLKTPNLLPAVLQCLTAMVDRAFEAAVSWLEDRISETGNIAETREATLSAHACFLLKNLSQREEHIREISVKLLTKLKDKFPQILWNSSCMDSLLFSVHSESPTTSGLVSDPGLVATVRSLYQKTVRDWILDSLSYAPCTTQGLLQEKICKSNTWQRTQQTTDMVSLLSEIQIGTSKSDFWTGTRTANIPSVMAAAAAASGANVKLTEAFNLEVLSTCLFSATLKCNYAGEIAGMRRLYETMGGFSSTGSTGFGLGLQRLRLGASPQQSQAEHVAFNGILLNRFVSQLQQFVNIAEKSGEVDKSSFREICSQATALLLSDLDSDSKSNLEGFSQLLRLLCWCPAYISTPDAMETGVFIWTWLVSAAPQLGSLVLAELVDAWLWTIDTKRGLFASEVRCSGPAAKLRPHLVPGEPELQPEIDPVQQIIAHRLWLGFFIDRFEVVRHSSVAELLLLGRMLQGTTKLPWNFSRHPVATGTFFTVMLLGLKFCSCQTQGNLKNYEVGLQLLEDRIYRASLGWFAYDPEWYDLNNTIFSQSEAQSVAAFVQFLSKDRVEALHSDSRVKGRENANSFGDTNEQYHPIWGHTENHASLREKRKLLLKLCQHESDRLEVWAQPTNSKEISSYRLKFGSEKENWIEYAKTAFSVDPRIALSLVSRFPTIPSLKTEVTQLVQMHVLDIRCIPEALPYFVTPKAVDENSTLLQQLPHWAACSITQALEFLTPAYKGHPRVMAYVLRVLESYPPHRVTFFMPQLVQALRYDEGRLVEGYLLRAAQRSDIFSHILIWHLQGETCVPEIENNTSSVKSTSFQEVLPVVRQRIIDGFTPKAEDSFKREFDFFDKVTSISGVLFPLPKEERRAGIQRELEKIEMNGEDLYLPTAPNKLVRGIRVDSGIPLQSAAKVPIMITFNVVDRYGDHNNIKPQACIFKVGDDCRQDVLALQVISLLRDIFEAVGLNLYLFPYGVLPTGPERGIIEVVPNTRSRSQMGETTDGGLYEIFQQDYGPVGSPNFEAARENFIISSAGYAVASLLLQPKDRHNGNLLFDNVGRLVHIDFGFILETSPGGNMRFESAHFKLSHEMTQLLDPSGVMKSEAWYQFVSLSVKGYLAARRYMDGILSTVLMMVDSGLPCFSRGDPIGNLRKRFHPEMNDREAANFMIKTCTDAYNKWTTAGYDLIQYLQQGIEK